MCQPGRPSPNGVLPGGFVALLGFPEHEIARISLVVFIHIDAGSRADAAEVVMRQLAVFGESGDAEVGRTVACVGAAVLRRGFSMAPTIMGMCSVALATLSARCRRRAALSSKKAFVYSAVYSPIERFILAALMMILSSTSVMFMT